MLMHWVGTSRSQRRVNWIGLWLVALLLVVMLRLPAIAGAVHFTELQFAPLPEVQLPEYTRFVTDNGMIVYLLEDRELPLVSGTALFRTGQRWESPEKTGLAGLTGTVMRTGGTKQHSGDELNELLEQRAATVETSISTASGSASFDALSEDLETVFGLFAEVIRQPVFAQDKLDLAKTQLRGSIARRNDEPGSIAQREFQKLIYGNESPYARIPEYQTVDNIAREDVVNFYQEYFYPNNMILGIVGDFDSQQMRSLIQKYFAEWQPKPGMQLPQLPTVCQAKLGGIFLVDQPQLTQSYLQIGHLGGQFNSPDYAALDVMNGVLNGFGGRLFNNVRSRQGLAYSVYGAWSPRYDYPGLFISGGQTRSDATVSFIQAMQKEIERLKTELVTPEELALAKDSVLNSFVFNFEDPAQTLTRLLRYEYYGYPADFLFRYRQAVEATTAEDIQRVAQTHLKPENLVTLVVGNAAAIQPPLTALASEVTPIDITIPEPEPVATQQNR